MASYTSIHLAARPTPGPITKDLFEVRTQDIPEIGPGEILVKQTHMSLDPAMIGWMSPDPESYIPPVGIGDIMRASGVGTVVASNHLDVVVGDQVRGMLGWSEYLVSQGEGLSKLPPELDAETVLSVFALPGLTATQDLYGFGDPKPYECSRPNCCLWHDRGLHQPTTRTRAKLDSFDQKADHCPGLCHARSF